MAMVLTTLEIGNLKTVSSKLAKTTKYSASLESLEIKYPIRTIKNRSVDGSQW